MSDLRSILKNGLKVKVILCSNCQYIKAQKITHSETRIKDEIDRKLILNATERTKEDNEQ